MELQEIIKRIYHTFFAVWSLIGVTICIFALVFRWQVIATEFFFALFFVAFLTSLTYIVFYSKKELDLRQLIIRLVIQFILVMGIVLTVGYFVGWISRQYPVYAVATVIATLVIFIAITAFELYQTWRLADILNLKLKERTGL
ncbi:MAG: hypothetical protein FWC77_00625 [Defluviitaleaceae bacterium]|nr:hypothetical protein [Defluviitaleaceae bacterium]